MSYLDTRDLQARLEELEARECDCDKDGVSHPQWSHLADCASLDDPLDNDEKEELAELRGLSEEVSEWLDGNTLIPEGDFKDYVREMAEDCAPSVEARELMETWPYNCIDWERAARELEYDYSQVTYQGADYFVRA